MALDERERLTLVDLRTGDIERALGCLSVAVQDLGVSGLPLDPCSALHRVRCAQLWLRESLRAGRVLDGRE